MVRLARCSYRAKIPLMARLALAMAAAAAVVALAMPTPAQADKGYGKAENDVVLHRKGFGIGVAVGGGQLLGLGKDNATGTGGSFSLRVGTTAGDKLSWFLEADTFGYLIERPVLDSQGMIIEGRTKVTANQSAVIAVGAQFFTDGALWFKVGAGYAVFTARAAQRTGPIDEQNGGVAGLGGIGLDLMRRGTFALDLELLGTMAIYGDGLVGGGGLLVGVNWY